MKLRHRVKAYGVGWTEPDYGDWTTDQEQLELSLDHFRDELYDWIYVEAEGVGAVAFDGKHSELESVHDYLRGDLG